MSKTGAILGYVKLLQVHLHKRKGWAKAFTLGGCNVTIQMGMLVQFLGLKFWQILLFFLGGVENWR